MGNPIKNNEIYEFGPFRLEARERLLLRDGQPVQISGKAFDLLLALLRSAGRLKTREELFEALWPNTVVEDTNLAWNMNGLRKALDDTGPSHRYVETVRGHGYRFIAPVNIIEETSPDKPGEEDTGPPSEGTQRRSRLRPKARNSLLIAAAVVIVGLLAWYFSTHPPGGLRHATAHSIAVLPFENLSTDKSNAYFAAGIQDTILTKLAGIGDLRVVSRTSTEHYPSHPQNLKEVARQLGVAAVLEGSVQKSGNQVLINVQLVDAKTDSHLWAHAYTRMLNNVFDVESDVAIQVASALKARLLPSEAARVAGRPTKNPQAYDLFLRAQYLATQVESESAQDPAKASSDAVSLYRQAISKDPSFALAYARLSYLESYMYWYLFDHTPARIASAKTAAKKALTLDPDLPQAHLAMGFMYYWGHRDYPAALAQFEQARQNLPNNADVVLAIAAIQRRQGKWQQAVSGFKQAAALDPRNPRWPEELGNTLTSLRRYGEAEAAYSQALAIEPHDYNALAYKALAQLLDGSPEQAARTLALIPADTNLGGLVPAARFEIAWLMHRPQAALQALADAGPWVQSALSVGRIPTALLRARAWSLLGDKARASQAYQKARSLLEDAVHKQPNNPNLWSSLGLADAGLGRKAEAIQSGKQATELLPVSKDALYGPSYLASLAAIYARSGETAKATGLLDKLLSMPAGWAISVPLLRLDPIWDPIRQDPTFRALLKQYEARQNPAPSVATR